MLVVHMNPWCARDVFAHWNGTREERSILSSTRKVIALDIAIAIRHRFANQIVSMSGFDLYPHQSHTYGVRELVDPWPDSAPQFNGYHVARLVPARFEHRYQLDISEKEAELALDVMNWKETESVLMRTNPSTRHQPLAHVDCTTSDYPPGHYREPRPYLGTISLPSGPPLEQAAFDALVCMMLDSRDSIQRQFRLSMPRTRFDETARLQTTR